MEDIYDYLHDVNTLTAAKNLPRFEEMVRKAILTGVLSEMLAGSLGKHGRVLCRNLAHNGHPDLIVRGKYADDKIREGGEGVEVKATVNKGGAVDMHAARDQWLCVFVYEVDEETQPVADRPALIFREIYLGEVTAAQFRRNVRLSGRGTDTSTVAREGLQLFRQSWVYLDSPGPKQPTLV